MILAITKQYNQSHAKEWEKVLKERSIKHLEQKRTPKVSDNIVISVLFGFVGSIIGFFVGASENPCNSSNKNHKKGNLFFTYFLAVSGILMVIGCFVCKEWDLLPWGFGLSGFSILNLVFRRIKRDFWPLLEKLNEALGKVVVVGMCCLLLYVFFDYFYGSKNVEAINWGDSDPHTVFTEALCPFGSWKHKDQIKFGDTLDVTENSPFGQKQTEIPIKQVKKIILTEGVSWSSIEVIPAGGIPILDNDGKRFYFRKHETYEMLDNLIQGYGAFGKLEFIYEKKKTLPYEVGKILG